MNLKNLVRAAVTVAAVVAAFSALGCGKKAGIHTVILNERPRVVLTSAPVSTADTAYYAYKLGWSAYDPDGRIDHFLYAIDPLGGEHPDTTWIRTSKNEETIFFRASIPDTNSGPNFQSNEPHTFVIKAIDDDNEQSPHVARSFFAKTVAPVVNIVNPRPTHLGDKAVTPSVRITWEGRDDDGVFTQKPVKYKYRLLSPGDAEYPANRAKSDPRAARRYFASTNFAGWDSTSAETTFAQFTNLTPSAGTGTYLFIVVGFDEAGSYSADWTLDNNMLSLNVGYAGTLGPRIGAFNTFFNYQYPSGGYAPNDELAWVKLEVPAGIPITVNWFASPPEGATIEWYRWKLDGDVADETPRTNENTDWYHWSQKSVGTTQCTIGPFPGGTFGGPGPKHNLYIEAMDNTGIKSIGTINMEPVLPTFESELLVVDDTRLELDQNTSATNTARRNYTTDWPAAAELDTFLYAQGGFTWRRTATGRSGVSTPGIFSGYSFDTLGTRQGFELASAGVPLSVIGKYRHIIWLVDRSASTKIGSPTDIGNAVSTLRWMNTPGRSSTLASYLYSGGNVWLAGGAGAYTSTYEFNAGGARQNDNIYGLGNTVFSNSAGELVGGRMMFDYARWQSEMVTALIVSGVRKSPRAIGGWSHPGVNYVGTVNAPDYSALPTTLRRRSLALGDSIPPTRTSGSGNLFYLTGSIAVEYMTQPNSIIEDADPDPLGVHEISTLDTLFELQGGPLATNITNQRPATMTYYHGFSGPPFLFSGFSPWEWTKTDCISLVDFVLQKVWGMQRRPGAPNRLAPPARTGRLGSQPAITTVQRPANTRLPLGRTRE